MAPIPSSSQSDGGAFQRNDHDVSQPAVRLPILDLNSADPLPGEWLRREPAIFVKSDLRHGDAVVIDSNSMLCHCPECGTPMAVRLWLMLADCWSCGISIELTELHRRLAKRRPEGRSATSSAVIGSKPAAVRRGPLMTEMLMTEMICDRLRHRDTANTARSARDKADSDCSCGSHGVAGTTASAQHDDQPTGRTWPSARHRSVSERRPRLVGQLATSPRITDAAGVTDDVKGITI